MGCLGAKGVWGGKMDLESNGEAPSYGIYLPTLKVCMPPFVMCCTVGGPYVGVDSELCYLS